MHSFVGEEGRLKTQRCTHEEGASAARSYVPCWNLDSQLIFLSLSGASRSLGRQGLHHNSFPSGLSHLHSAHLLQQPFFSGSPSLVSLACPSFCCVQAPQDLEALTAPFDENPTSFLAFEAPGGLGLLAAQAPAAPCPLCFGHELWPPSVALQLSRPTVSSPRASLQYLSCHPAALWSFRSQRKWLLQEDFLLPQSTVGPLVMLSGPVASAVSLIMVCNDTISL